MLLGLLAVLSLKNLQVLKVHKTKAVKKIFVQEKIIIQITFVFLG